ncbi:hypothetical protein GOHSU_27_00700 [Gordonia hirsuta DSM 44140 = NBRC 16056]|uniref:Maltokinase N-terminal cap domain-containing protein n=1 Tax=Gordonia hirsuta DSM 44140 = NBRC 16056 TaxID=1121927 RepID=L7LAJ3_9ACTN|nr:hypothetical protein [Gordonia hirsuta]GAC57934.1 hypothetical protein GOHSU_27_00700 [Gordonia hirsuta DSM 44140 = NBRC 16056]
MSGVAVIYDAELSPTKEEIAARHAGIGALHGSYRLVDPDGVVGIEVLVGPDAQGRTAQFPVTYRPAEVDPAHTLTRMDHSVLGERWVTAALGDPVAVTQLLRTIVEGDDGARRSDGVPAVLELRGTGAEQDCPVTDVALAQVSADRVRGTAALGGQVRSFELVLPQIVRELSGDADETVLRLLGRAPGSPEHPQVLAELILPG